MWNPDKYLDTLYAKNSLELEFDAKDETEWEQWRMSLKDAFVKDLGCKLYKKVELNPRLIEEVKCDGYIRQRVVYTTGEHLETPAYVLIPDSSKKSRKGRFPAVVACHGHGYGSREIVGLKPDGTDNTGDPGYQKNFAVELARHGFLVVAPDILGFGDRRLAEDSGKPLAESSCHRISTYLLMMGTTIAGVRVQDTVCTVDYLCSRKDVDRYRIGCMGISGGGLVCAFTSAIEERIKVTVISGYTNTFKDSVMAIFHCVDNFVPGLLKHAEMPDVIGLIPPRPLLIESGTDDVIFPVDTVYKAYSKLERIYGLLGVEEKLDRDIFKGEHRISGEKAYQWFDKWL